MLKNVFSAVAGVIVEPVKGAKEGGIKGSARGLGKGLLGLICKPVKGTIDLVTQTTRGISNTPRTMYIGMTRMIRTVPKQVTNKKVDLKDDCFIGETEGETLYISKRRLKEQLERSELLSSLLYQSAANLSPEEQEQVKTIVLRQRELLKNKQNKLLQ